MKTTAPTIAAMEQAGWKFEYASSAYRVCVWSPNGTHIDTADIRRAYTPSCAQRTAWLSEWAADAS